MSKFGTDGCMYQEGGGSGTVKLTGLKMSEDDSARLSRRSQLVYTVVYLVQRPTFSIPRVRPTLQILLQPGLSNMDS